MVDDVQLRGPIDGGSATAAFCVLTISAYFTAREALQMVTMRRMGLLLEYTTDAWNSTDLSASVLTFLVRGGGGATRGTRFASRPPFGRWRAWAWCSSGFCFSATSRALKSAS